MKNMLTVVDGVIVVMLLVGIFHGRKRGMSQELIDLIKWILTIVGCSFGYSHISPYISANGVMSHTFYNIASYMLIALVIALIMSAINTRFGSKLSGSDFFGGAEYYLGMLSGFIRYACIAIFLMSILHAPYYTTQEIADFKKKMAASFGDGLTVGGWGGIQEMVFKESVIGSFMETYCNVLLIKPVQPKAEPAKDSPLKRKNKDLEAIVK